MSKWSYVIGIDTSKSVLDLVVRHQGKVLLQQQIANEVAGIRKFIKQLRKLPGFHSASALFCMEHTGLYNAHLLQVLEQARAQVSILAAAHIQQSLGLQRGKNDQIDAQRIAEYADRFTDKLTLWQAARPVLQQLQHLLSLRERLLKAQVQLQVPLEEAKAFMDPATYELLQRNSRSSLKGLKADLQRIEEHIQELIDSDEHLGKLFKQLQSVPGVGPVTAGEIIIRTNEFKTFNDPKKFACHAGVAPFEHRSGSSVRGRSRVSHKAQKRLKTLLHLAAMAAVRMNGELRQYYLRKVEQGKNKMAVLNAVRNKIILRIFAIVRNDLMYQKNFDYSLQGT
jgi:transposase